MLYSVDGSGQSSPQTTVPATFPWLITAVLLHALYVGVGFYLVEYRNYDVITAAGLAIGLMLAAGVVLRLAMPASAGGWAVTVPLVRLGRAFLRPWLAPTASAAPHLAGAGGSAQAAGTGTEA
ncbi:hypothetical protein ABGB12_34910 [Actinocorallia sp. B10E7]|uniref:hypothetical protein n=1 Tax=Actinocorallia sp. B10E7 TaxID=3153558 RepID=UPI00325D315D